MTDKEQFMEVWNGVIRYRKELDRFLAPAREAILSRVHDRQSMWFSNDAELTDDGQGNYRIIISGEYYVGMGRIDHDSYMIPLEACLAGKSAVLDFFVEEERKQQETASLMGQQKEARDREARQQIYLRLKAEFETGEALVKS
jgi:hypothetical protein